MDLLGKLPLASCLMFAGRALFDPSFFLPSHPFWPSFLDLTHLLSPPPPSAPPLALYNAPCEWVFPSSVSMTDQSPPEKSPAGSLRISPGKEACVIRYLDSQRSSSVPLPSNLYQRRATRHPSLRLETQDLDQATSPFALLT